MLLFIFLLVHEYTLFLHLEETFETALEEMQLDTDVLEEIFALKLELVLFRT